MTALELYRAQREAHLRSVGFFARIWDRVNFRASEKESWERMADELARLRFMREKRANDPDYWHRELARMRKVKQHSRALPPSAA